MYEYLQKGCFDLGENFCTEKPSIGFIEFSYKNGEYYEWCICTLSQNWGCIPLIHIYKFTCQTKHLSMLLKFFSKLHFRELKRISYYLWTTLNSPTYRRSSTGLCEMSVWTKSFYLNILFRILRKTKAPAVHKICGELTSHLRPSTASFFPSMSSILLLAKKKEKVDNKNIKTPLRTNENN